MDRTSTSGMAHRWYVAPDQKAVLVVEMDDRGIWIPCRLVPFDGGSPGRAVGPPNSRCTEAAWAPDGRWMYFTADAGEGFHLWRQAYPDGVPEQLTSAITQEEGLAIAPDGKSLITSVGLRRRANFIRSTSGEERQIPSEGYTFWPLFSADGQKICYRVTRGAATGQTPAGALGDGRGHRTKRAAVARTTGDGVRHPSRDDRVVAAILEADGSRRIWLAWLYGREPARPIPANLVIGDNPRFLDRDRITFRGQAGQHDVAVSRRHGRYRRAEAGSFRGCHVGDQLDFSGRTVAERRRLSSDRAP